MPPIPEGANNTEETPSADGRSDTVTGFQEPQQPVPWPTDSRPPLDSLVIMAHWTNQGEVRT